MTNSCSQGYKDFDSNSTEKHDKNNVSIVERLVYAKWFIDHGFAVFPIDPQSKKPVISQWQKYSHQSLSDEEKQRFLKMIEEGHNYAVPGGQKGLVILDFENKELLKAWLGEELEKLCNQTLCVNTVHGGLHIYLISDEIPPHKFNPAFVLNGETVMDLQSFNSYVVGPESCINHKTCTTDKCPWKGQDYVSCYYGELKEIGKFNLKDLLRRFAELGKKLGIELTSSAHAWVYGKKEDSKDEKSKEDDEDKVRLYHEVVKQELIKRDSGKSIEEIKEEICRKHPPRIVKAVICEGKTYDDLKITDRSVTDYHIVLYLMEHGVTHPDKILQLLPPDSKMHVDEKWDVEKYQAVTFVNAWDVAKKKLEAKKKAKTDKSTARALVIEAIAEEILNSYDLVTFISRDQVKESVIGLFIFNKEKGIYEPFDASIEAIINSRLSGMDLVFDLGFDKTRTIRNIKEEIMRRTQHLMLEEPLRIAFKNGTLEWKENGIIWYPKEVRTTDQYAFNYLDWELKIEEIEKYNGKDITIEDIEELARRLCPRALETFKQWVDEKWVLLFEIIGYTLYPKYIFNKAILLVGSGANGKSTFLNLLLKILGKHNVSAMPLKRILGEDRFATIELYHKLANISSELFAFEVTNTDTFKKATGEDYMEGQKKFKDPVYFINYAKLINATNELPIVKDQTHGFWRRWLVVEFPHQFEPDPNFFNRVFTNEEIEGVIAVSVVAFGRVLLRRKFDFEDTSADVKEMWERRTDSVYAFVKEMIESGKAEYNPNDGDLFTPTEEFYQAYVTWCEENDRKAESKAIVTQRLQSKFKITKDRKTIGGKKVMCYVGIRLKTDEDTGEDTSKDSVKNEPAGSILDFVNIPPSHVVEQFEKCLGFTLGAMTPDLLSQNEIREEKLMKYFKGQVNIVEKVGECLEKVGYRREGDKFVRE